MAAIYADYEARQIRFDAKEHREGGKVEGLIGALARRSLMAASARGLMYPRAIAAALSFRVHRHLAKAVVDICVFSGSASDGLQREFDQHRKMVRTRRLERAGRMDENVALGEDLIDRQAGKAQAFGQPAVEPCRSDRTDRRQCCRLWRCGRWRALHGMALRSPASSAVSDMAPSDSASPSICAD